MFKFQHVYTHNRMLDAAILVIKNYRLLDGRYKLKIRWMNRRGMDLGIIENVTIKKEEVKNWYLL